MASRIFISYSSVDQNEADKLADALDAIGVEYFLDKKNISWGDDFTEQIMAGLSECAAVIVILSPASTKSQWVPFEIGHAMGRKKTILPYLTHPSLDVPSFLKRFQHVTSVDSIIQHFLQPKYHNRAGEDSEIEVDADKDKVQLRPNRRLFEALLEFPRELFQGLIAIDGAIELMSFPDDKNRYGGISRNQVTTVVTTEEWSVIAESRGFSRDSIASLAKGLRNWLPMRRAKPNRIRFLLEPPVQPVLDHKELILKIGNSDYFTMRAISEISRKEKDPNFGVILKDIFKARWGQSGKQFPEGCIPYHISAQGVLFVTDPTSRIKYLVLSLPSAQRSPIAPGWNATFAEQMWAPSPSSSVRPWWADYADGFDIEAPKERKADEHIEDTLIRGLEEELGIKRDDLDSEPKLISAIVEQDLYFVAFIFVINVRMTLEELYKRKGSAPDREIGLLAAYPIQSTYSDGQPLDTYDQFSSILNNDSFNGSSYILPEPMDSTSYPWHLSSRMRIYASARHLAGNEVMEYVQILGNPLSD